MSTRWAETPLPTQHFLEAQHQDPKAPELGTAPVTPPGAPRSHGRLAGPWESSGGRHFCGRLAPQGGLGKGRGDGGGAAGAEPRSPGEREPPPPPASARLRRRPSTEWGIGPSPSPSSLRCESQGTPALHLPVPASSPGCSRPVGLQRGRGVCDREAKAAVTMAAGAQGSPQRMRLCPCLPQRGFQGSAATRGGEVKGQLSRQQQPPLSPRPGGRGGAANQLASHLHAAGKSGPPTGPWLR